MAELYRAIEAGDDRAHQAIEGARLAPSKQPVAPLQKVVLGGAFELTSGEGIGVDSQLVLAEGDLGRIRAAVALEVGEVCLERFLHSAAHRAPDRRGADGCAPFLGRT